MYCMAMSLNKTFYTMEKQAEIQLAFLKVLMSWTEQRLRKSVYANICQIMLKFDSYHIQSTRTRIVWCLHHQAHVATLTCTNMISIRNHIQGNNYFAGITSAFTNRDGVVRTTTKHLRGTSEKIQMLFKSRTIL